MDFIVYRAGGRHSRGRAALLFEWCEKIAALLCKWCEKIDEFIYIQLGSPPFSYLSGVKR